MRPAIGLNATFNNGGANVGNLAFVSQSGALCTAILDWAHTNDVGFSSVVSMGSSADVDFGEILDYLVNDQQTQNILLYIEGIRNSRSFMSSLRAAARIKPVILVKGCIFYELKIRAVFRPFCLARYIAVSAFFSNTFSSLP